MQPRRFLALLAVAGVAALALLPAPVAQAAPPPNDNFANRIVLTGQAVSSGPITIDEATREGLEPSNNGKQTVWWTWTAPQDGIVTITSQGTTYGNLLTVFTGTSLASLSQIAQNQGSAANVTFPVKAGLIYQMSIASVFIFGENGTATINIRNASTTITAPVVVGLPSKANDDFGNAASLFGPVVSGFTYNTDATREGQEPSTTGARTVWWNWVAPTDAQVTMTTAGTNFGAILNAFNGNSLSELRIVARAQGSPASVTFPAKAGFSYRAAVGMVNSGDNGAPVINITTAPLAITSPVVVGSSANANDNYASAQSLGSYQTVSGFGYNTDASVESLEASSNGRKTLWWTWTAPIGGTLGVDLRGTDVSPTLSVFVGDNIASAVNVSPNFKVTGSLAVSGVVQGGTIYHFSMGSNSNGTYVLNLNLAPSGTAVTIAPDGTAEAFEGGAKGAFIFTRIGNLAGPVTVAYKVGGTATGGVQYKTLPGFITIPAGASSAKVKVKPIDDQNRYGSTTVKVTLLPGEGYGVGTPASAKVKVRDND